MKKTLLIPSVIVFSLIALPSTVLAQEGIARDITIIIAIAIGGIGM